MEQFITISSKASEDAFSANLFKLYSGLDIASWLGSIKVKSESPHEWDVDLLTRMAAVLPKQIRSTLLKKLRVDGLTEGIEKNIAKIHLLDKVAQPVCAKHGCSKCVEKLVNHFTKQLAAVWTNFSLLFQFYNIEVTVEDIERFCFCGFVWSWASSCENVFKFALADAFASWTKNKVWVGEFVDDKTRKLVDRFAEERPPVPNGMSKNSLFFMFSERFGYNLKTSSFPILRDREKRWVFWFSVLQAKKGTNPIPAWDVDAGLTDTFATLTSPEEYDALLDPILTAAIYTTVKEVLRPASKTHRPLLPSPSAAEGYTRSEGGGLQGVSEHLWSTSTDDDYAKINYPTNFDYFDPYDESTRFEYTDLPQDLLRNLWSDRTLNPEVTAHKVLEPFKLRVITTGPPVDYYIAKYVNKIVHGQVMRHPTFCFTAGPVTIDKLENFYLWSDEVLESVDYKAATDNMKGRYSRLCWHAICCALGWTWEVYEWGSQSLTRNILKFKLSNGSDLVGLQERGQLMGNFLSFFVLCLCNAAALRVVEQTSRDGYLPQRSNRDLWVGRGANAVKLGIQNYKFRKLRECRVSVNGDDGLVVIKPRDRNILSWVTSAMGFTLSVGKSYSSREFGMINSKLFTMETNLFGLKVPAKLLPYMNLGLIKGTGRVLSDTRRDDLSSKLEFYSDCGTKAHKLIDGFDHGDRDVLMSMFIGWNEKALKSTMRDWYLPRNLGGLELPNTGHIAQMSKHASLVASYAQTLGGINIDPSMVSNVASRRYRQTVPHTIVDRADLPEEYESCDDTVYFWRAGTKSRESVETAEGRFMQHYRLAIKAKVAPMRERVQRRWVSIPSVSFIVPALPLPFFDGDILT